MQTLHAIYENGIFRPIEPVNLPDTCEQRGAVVRWGN
ncbi:MAG: DUF104 domain-containing protein [Candidatus Competibacteraceae bacterium]|nr:DUF104 domain-containing protein [Candidatus Competibacteraceae bacterium]